MKRGYLYLLAVMLLMFWGSLQAQSFSEWFRQKKTQKKYLLAQIAALETYARVIKKGYELAGSGLSMVAALKNGDFMQHTLRFSTLEMVSPRIKNYSKVLAITELEDKAARSLRSMMEIKDLEYLLSPRELNELRQADAEMRSEAAKDLEQLELLVSDGRLKMTDDARIRLIDQLYIEVQKEYSQTMNLTRGIRMLTDSRRKRAGDTRMLKKVYGQ